MIEHEQIDGLIDAAGADVAEAVLEAFWTSADDLVLQARAALAAGDAEGLDRAGHALKGAALNVGAVAVAEAARRIEAAARAGELSPVGEALDRIDDVVAPAKAAFAARIALRRAAS